MKRRELLVGAGALGALGVGGAVAFGVVDPLDDGETVGPFELERFDAPGSTPGTEMVPEEGTVTYLALFATWCGTCRTKMEPLGEAVTRVGDDVQFVSVTNEPVGHTVSPEDVIEWWHEYDGSWPVAHDDTLDLTQAVGGRGVPYSVVFDVDNQVVWSDSGYKDADEVLEQIERAGGTVE